MVNPDMCWVCNVRTIWLHLAWNRGPGDAEELLKLFREGAADSEMAYMRWADEYHPKLQRTLIDVATEGRTAQSPRPLCRVASCFFGPTRLRLMLTDATTVSDRLQS